MTAYRNFDRAVEEDRGEPVRFTVGGEDFDVYDFPIGSLMRALGQNEVALYKESFRAMLGDDYVRFEEALIRSRLGIDELDAMSSWIVEQLAARPTRRPSGSPSSPSPDGPSSNRVSENSEPAVTFS